MTGAFDEAMLEGLTHLDADGFYATQYISYFCTHDPAVGHRENVANYIEDAPSRSMSHSVRGKYLHMKAMMDRCYKLDKEKGRNRQAEMLARVLRRPPFVPPRRHRCLMCLAKTRIRFMDVRYDTADVLEAKLQRTRLRKPGEHVFQSPQQPPTNLYEQVRDQHIRLKPQRIEAATVPPAADPTPLVGIWQQNKALNDPASLALHEDNPRRIKRLSVRMADDANEDFIRDLVPSNTLTRSQCRESDATHRETCCKMLGNA